MITISEDRFAAMVSEMAAATFISSATGRSSELRRERIRNIIRDLKYALEEEGIQIELSQSPIGISQEP